MQYLQSTTQTKTNTNTQFSLFVTFVKSMTCDYLRKTDFRIYFAV